MVSEGEASRIPWLSHAMDLVYVLTFLTLCLTLTALQVDKSSAALSIQKLIIRKEQRNVVDESGADDQIKTQRLGFCSFQRTYLSVYFLAVAADWLQGPMVYALYDAYGFSKHEIAALFIAGFGSSMVLGTYAGALADNFGRKRLALVYCAFYTVSCLTKHFPHFGVLLVGRLLGGMATSLLFSVFEAWYVNEHESRGFPAEWLSESFSRASFGNGLVAILCGQLAGLVAGPFGFVAPFDVAIGVLVLVAVLIHHNWTENYGMRGEHVSRGLQRALRHTLRDSKMRWLGILQSCFEAAMYIFVFLWTPALQGAQENPTNPIPHGMIFSTFMVALMLGSVLFDRILRRITREEKDASAVKTMNNAVLWLMQILLAISICSFVVAAVGDRLHWSAAYLAMIGFEVTCGLYFPAMGCLRGILIPEECRAAVMNLFRVPMNLLVVLILAYVDRFTNRSVFFAAAGLNAIALLALVRLKAAKPEPDTTGEAHA